MGSDVPEISVNWTKLHRTEPIHMQTKAETARQVSNNQQFWLHMS